MTLKKELKKVNDLIKAYETLNELKEKSLVLDSQLNKAVEYVPYPIYPSYPNPVYPPYYPTLTTGSLENLCSIASIGGNYASN